MKRLLLTILIISLAGFALAQNTTKLKSNLTIEKSAPTLYLNGTSAGIDFYNGDVTLQQSSNTLTLGGGNFSLGTNSLLGTGSIGATGTRLLKGWFTDLEITNLPTVNGAAFKTALALTASDVGLGNVTNESKATMFTNPTFTGTLYTAGNIIPTQMYGNTALGTSQYPIGNIIINQGNGISWNNTYWDPLATDVGIFECEGGLDIWADSLRLVPGSFGTPARPVVLGYFTDLDISNDLALTGSINITGASISNTELAALDGVTGSLNYSTENYGATGMGDVVFSIGATMTSPNITNAPVATGTVVAGTGITAAMLSRFMYFNTAAAIDITADPQIANGTSGQLITIIGSSDTNTLTLDDATGLRLTGQMVLGIGDNITLLYEGTIGDWIEISRSNN